MHYIHNSLKNSLNSLKFLLSAPIPLQVQQRQEENGKNMKKLSPTQKTTHNI